MGIIHAGFYTNNPGACQSISFYLSHAVFSVKSFIYLFEITLVYLLYMYIINSWTRQFRQVNKQEKIMRIIKSNADEQLFLTDILDQLVQAGLSVRGVADEESFTKCSTVADAVDNANAVEEATIRMRDADGNKFSIFIAWGNREAIIADHTDSALGDKLSQIVDSLLQD